MAAPTKPLILMTVTPFAGHVLPLRVIANGLVKRGYNVTVITASAYKQSFEKVGCTFVSLPKSADFTETDIDTRFPDRSEKAAGPERLMYDLEHLFFAPIPAQFATVQDVLRTLQTQHPNQKIIHLNESFFLGALPLAYGAPGPRPHKVFNVGIAGLTLNSVDTAPFGPGLPPSDGSEESRKRNIEMTEMVEQTLLATPNAQLKKHMLDLGATKPLPKLMDTFVLGCDYYFQMCIPSAEYPRSDAPSSLRFAGSVPSAGRDVWSSRPSWWDDVAVNSAGKKIVGICQGTVTTDCDLIVKPAIKALKDRPDVLVVIALGHKGAVVPENITPAANCRIADFIPYDDLMPHCDMFISSGGYGGFQHALSNACPLILAGVSEDKAETCARGEWCGLGINLKTESPTVEAIRGAVDLVLSTDKYKKRALELQAESRRYDSIQIIADSIEEFS